MIRPRRAYELIHDALPELDLEAIDLSTATLSLKCKTEDLATTVFTKSDSDFEKTEDMIREFRVDAVISERLMFCDISGYEQFLLGSDFKAAGIPYLQLAREYMLGGVGQMRTRVQAFLESIEE